MTLPSGQESSHRVLLPQPRSITYGVGTVENLSPEVTFDASLPAEGYRIDVQPEHVSLVAADAAGAFYGHQTLDQLRQDGEGRLPICSVRDWPDLPVRGVMLDISRDKVPTMSTLEGLVDQLSSWKVNQLQLYTEHTFAYADHEEVWADASPMTAAEIRALDVYCRDRHVELVPNQNCFGHLKKWLQHDRYRPLALTPNGYEQDGLVKEPTTLDPTNPAAFELVRSLLAELLPNFSSKRVHVGLDEPWELPPEQIDDYLDWVRRLRAQPELEGYDVLMWGDILAGRPDLLAQLPDGVTVCEWGYDDWYPFDDRARGFAEAQRSFWVCPGTSSWMTVLGRWTNTKGNCLVAAEAALAHGAGGFLNTDWGDQGHLQYPLISDPGFAYGAAVSWCLDTNRDLDVGAALDTHCYRDDARVLGEVVLSLGDAYRRITPQVPNVSALVLTLYFPQLHLGRGPMKGITADEVDTVRSQLRDCRSRLDLASPQRSDATLLIDELRTAIDLVLLVCSDATARLAGDGSLESVPASTRAELAGATDALIARHRDLWLARNRVGGLDDSVSWLEHLRDCYLSGTTDRTWGQRIAP